MKKVIVINGKGTAGKDTLCEFVGSRYSIVNVSAITPIKEAAKLLGWQGDKDEVSRKFLADLKQLSVKYNDYPNIYLTEQYNLFMSGNSEIMFVHIREADQIYHFIQSVSSEVVTLLIKRLECDALMGNDADDNVESFPYDYVYHNDKPLDEAETDFMHFFDAIIVRKPTGEN